MAAYNKTYKLRNGMDLLLRSPEESDAEQMIGYLNTVGGESDNLTFGKNGFHLNVEQEREYLKKVKAAPNTLMLLGFIDGNIVSMAHIDSPEKARIAHNSELAISVKKEYWHMGIGSVQMTELIGFVKNRGTVRNISLGVRDRNPNAIKLYEKCGFVKVGVHKNFFNIDGNFFDEILMDLYLN